MCVTFALKRLLNFVSFFRLSHGRFLFKHPDRRTVWTFTQTQLQPSFLHQPRAARSALPRLVAEEQARIQRRTDQIYRRDVEEKRRVLCQHVASECRARLHTTYGL